MEDPAILTNVPTRYDPPPGKAADSPKGRISLDRHDHSSDDTHANNLPEVLTG